MGSEDKNANRAIKSISWDGVRFGEDAVAVGGGLGPDPALADVVVVEISPEVVLSPLGLGPVPGLLDGDGGAVHVVHVVAVGEGGHLGIMAEIVLAELGTGDVAVDFEASDGVGEGDDSSGPALVEGLVGVVEGGEGGVEFVEGPVEFLMVDDAGYGEDLRAGGVALLGVAAIAGHPAHITVPFLGPDSGLEGQSLLRHHSLSVVREELVGTQPEGQ